MKPKSLHELFQERRETRAASGAIARRLRRVAVSRSSSLSRGGSKPGEPALRRGDSHPDNPGARRNGPAG
ncbi:MAG: hypothetical protein WD314_03050 [Trueperaceae bacterium]